MASVLVDGETLTWTAAVSLVRSGHETRDHPPVEFDVATGLPDGLAKEVAAWARARGASVEVV